MLTAELRRRWLDFFSDRGHTVVPSASLVSDDPTLLFTVAGMVPFIPYLTGLVPSPYARATSVQKCIRTLDIEEVGKTTRHGTFFQMNGNFSFGDYFKKEAIEYAWELLTRSEAQGGFGFSERDLWVTVYENDDDAAHLWKKTANLPDERIQRLGKKTNFWSTGVAGPAGPCSEIFFDRGPRYGVDGGPAADEERYIEIWNLVFMQYLRGEGTGKAEFEILGDLPTKNIDTGMGLERVAFIKQDVENLYEIDQVRPVLDVAAELSGKRYGARHDDDVRMRVVADHVRSALMLLSDGVMPSNEGRGYIVRRLLRRTVRALRLLGVNTVAFPQLFPVSRDSMNDAYSELDTHFSRIAQTAYSEEEAFLQTLTGGTAIIDVAVESTRARGLPRLAGDTAFLLHDTYGFPIDLTLEIAAEAGLSVDRAAFDRLMSEQRQRAKADARAKKALVTDLSVYSAFRAHGETIFTGYDSLETESTVIGLIVNGISVVKAVTGETVEVILADTSLYAEAGGQEADAGSIVGAGFELEILDVQRPVKGLISHRARVAHGEVAVGDRATSSVDAEWRRGATQAHSGTHILHAALREVLGPAAHQSGSYNKAGYFRLDFTWNQGLSTETRSEIEDISNRAIRNDLLVETREMPLSEAKALGAMALFGEKYGEQVRVVEIGGSWSRELCGGTHVRHSSEIGLISVLSESSVGSANRRVESLVGLDAFRDFAAERALVTQLTVDLKTPRDQLTKRINDLVSHLKTAERKIARFEARALSDKAPGLLERATTHGEYTVVASDVGKLASSDDLRTLTATVRDRLGTNPAVVALTASVANKPVIIVATNAAARTRGAQAGHLARAAASELGGGGGGTDELAQGGGSVVETIPQALSAAIDALGR